ncbi:MAG: methyltransferase domain-containing protein [Deltaproteobacteria bacterium]|nr:methyltransferase domain-containing protein [Deltaproteobacteria bacterium]
MGEDREDEDILELTEDMTSVPPAAPQATERDTGTKAEEPPRARESLRGSTAPSQPVSPFSGPFKLLATPKPREEEPEEEAARESRPDARSYVPHKSAVAVMAMPIRRLGTATPSAKKVEKEIPAPAPPQSEEPTIAQEPDITEDSPIAATSPDRWSVEAPQPIAVEATGEDDEIMDLHQGMVVDPDAAVPEPGSALVEAAPEVALEAPTSIAAHVEGPDLASVFDFGTPEMVFDTLKLHPADETASPGAEEEMSLDLAEAEDITPEESEEELDLAEVEEIVEKPAARQSAPAVPARARMRKRKRERREWWAEIFNDDYLALSPKYAGRDTRRETDFVEQMIGAPKDSLILDLACGPGRHAVAMAKRGYRVVGVDLSLPMLARAGDLAQEAGQKINFIQGDMRDLRFDQTFDAIYCVGTSFGYFDDQTNAKVLEGIHRALKPRAPLLLEVANRDHLLGRQPNLTWFMGDGCVCMEETDFNFINSRLYVSRTLIMEGTGRQVKHNSVVRLYSLHELGMMLHNAGFVVTKLSGHHATPGAFFGADSALLAIIAERRS